MRNYPVLTFFSKFKITSLLSLVVISTFFVFPLPLKNIGVGSSWQSENHSLNMVETRSGNKVRNTVTDRPFISIEGYSFDPKNPVIGSKYELSVTVKNNGLIDAQNIRITFPSGEIVPLENGGINIIQILQPGETETFVQPFTSLNSLIEGIKTTTATIVYNDPIGTEYKDEFTIAANFVKLYSAGSIVSNPTATPVIKKYSQLVIEGFTLSQGDTNNLDYLVPGNMFMLNLDAVNIGNYKALNVVMVLGGAAGNGSGMGGSTGNSSIISPVNSSNITPLGDINKNEKIKFSKKLMVNKATISGTYNLQVSFVYDNSEGNKVIDDQILSFQVRVKPQVLVGLNPDIGTASVGLSVPLPLVVTNLGSSAVQLGGLDISCDGWEITPSTFYIGKIDAGEQWYPSVDVYGVPKVEGVSTCLAKINYFDEFGIGNEITNYSLKLSSSSQTSPEIPFPTVEPSGTLTPGQIITPIETQSPNPDLWSKMIKFFSGFLGLDSN